MLSELLKYMLGGSFLPCRVGGLVISAQAMECFLVQYAPDCNANAEQGIRYLMDRIGSTSSPTLQKAKHFTMPPMKRKHPPLLGMSVKKSHMANSAAQFVVAHIRPAHTGGGAPMKMIGLWRVCYGERGSM